MTACAGGSRAGRTRAAARSSSAATPDGTIEPPDARRASTSGPGSTSTAAARYLVDGDLVVVSDFATGRLNRVDADRASSTPLTPERAWRFADIDRRPRAATGSSPSARTTSPRRSRATARPRTAWSRSTSTAARSRVLVSGADFYRGAAPVARRRRGSPGSRGTTRTCRGTGRSCGSPTSPRTARSATASTVAGSPTDWIAQPRWSPDGVLHFVAEPNGLDEHLPRSSTAGAEPLAPSSRRSSRCPDWVFGCSNYGFAADGSIVAIGRSGGRDRLYRIGRRGGPRRRRRRAVHRDRQHRRRRRPGRPPAPPRRRARRPSSSSTSRPARRRSSGGRSTPTFDPADDLRRRAGRVPDDRRPDRVRAVLPAAQPARSRPRRRAAAADRHEPRRPDRRRLRRRSSIGDPAVHEPRLRGPRRRLRRQHRLRPRLPQAARGRVGRRRPRRLRQRRALARASAASSTASGWRSAAAARAATRRSAPSRSATRSGPGRATSGSATSRRSSTQTHKFESRYLDRLVGPYPEREGPLPRPLAAQLRRPDLVPGADPPGRRGPGRAAGPGRADRRRAVGAAAARTPTCSSRARTTASARPRTSSARSRPSCRSTARSSASSRPTRSSRSRSSSSSVRATDVDRG